MPPTESQAAATARLLDFDAIQPGEDDLFEAPSDERFGSDGDEPLARRADGSASASAASTRATACRRQLPLAERE